MATHKTKKRMEANRKQCEYEAKVVNSSFDELFKNAENKNDAQSQSQVFDKDNKNNTKPTFNKNGLNIL